MLKKYVSLTVALLFFHFYGFSQVTSIPDTNFEQALIDLNIDSDTTINGQVLTSDIIGVSSLSVDNKNIASLTGIQDFESLVYLDCSGNQLTGLNTSQSNLLEILDCSDNLIGALNIAPNTLLTSLNCSENQLNSLSITQNTALEYLKIQDNNIIGSLVTPSTLEVLDISHNNFTSVDVTGSPQLESVLASSNLLTNIDISQNSNLLTIECDSNQLTSLDLSANLSLLQINCSYNQISSLSVSLHDNLSGLICNDNVLTELNTRNFNNDVLIGFDARNNPNLFCIDVNRPSHANGGFFQYTNWEVDSQVTYELRCSPDPVPIKVCQINAAPTNGMPVYTAGTVSTSNNNDQFELTSEGCSIACKGLVNQLPSVGWEIVLEGVVQNDTINVDSWVTVNNDTLNRNNIAWDLPTADTTLDGTFTYLVGFILSWENVDEGLGTISDGAFTMPIDFDSLGMPLPNTGDTITVLGIVEADSTGTPTIKEGVWISNGTVGITEIQKENVSINFYPNPANDIIRVISSKEIDLTAEIYDILGKCVLKQKINNETLDISELRKGLHVISFFSGNQYLGSSKILIE